MTNKQPVSYLQKDERWKNQPYRVKDESSTVGSAGCGPTCASMCIETLTGKSFTPLDACNWSMEHGYKALKQGTYYSYFESQFRAYGIDCKMLNWENSYGKPNHKNHDKVKAMVNDGYYAIALMNKGRWTSSGHFVLVWDWNDKVRINDPNSTSSVRLNGDPYTFKSQAKYYWLVDARAYNRPKADNKEDEDTMTGDQILSTLTDKQAYNLLMKAQRYSATLPEPAWSFDEGYWHQATEEGVVNGQNPESLMKRDEVITALYRMVKG